MQSSFSHQRPKISAASLRNRHAGATNNNHPNNTPPFQQPPPTPPHSGSSVEQKQHQQQQDISSEQQHQHSQHVLDEHASIEANPSTFPRLIDAYELPTHVRHSAQDIKNLFSAAFGPVHSVQVVDPVSGHARVQFFSATDLNLCLGRIIQHEEFDDDDDDDDNDTSEVGDMRTHRGLRRRGYVFLGYYRILVDGNLEMSSTGIAQTEKSLAAKQQQQQRRQKRRRSPSHDGTSQSDVGSSSHSSGDDEEDDASGADEEDDAEAFRQGKEDMKALSVAPAAAAAAGTGVSAESTQNCLVLLRIIELPVDSSASGASSTSSQHSLSGLLSPLVVYQMLRDVCLPLKIVLCKKQQTPAAPSSSSSVIGSKQLRARMFESRNVLVQVDKHESVSAVIGAFNGTVVELMESEITANTSRPLTSSPINGGKSLPSSCSVNPHQESQPLLVRVGVHPQVAKPVVPLQPQHPQQQKRRVVAARFRVLACESRQDSGRPNELNVPINIAGCMSISKQTIMKMGGIFDRSWVTPATAVAAAAVASPTDSLSNGDDFEADDVEYDDTADDQRRHPEVSAAVVVGQRATVNQYDDEAKGSEDDDDGDQSFVDHGKVMEPPVRYSRMQQNINQPQAHRNQQHTPPSRHLQAQSDAAARLPPPQRSAFSHSSSASSTSAALVSPPLSTSAAHAEIRLPTNRAQAELQQKDQQHLQHLQATSTVSIRVGGVPLPAVSAVAPQQLQHQQAPLQQRPAAALGITVASMPNRSNGVGAVAPITVRVGGVQHQQQQQHQHQQQHEQQQAAPEQKRPAALSVPTAAMPDRLMGVGSVAPITVRVGGGAPSGLLSKPTNPLPAASNNNVGDGARLMRAGAQYQSPPHRTGCTDNDSVDDSAESSDNRHNDRQHGQPHKAWRGVMETRRLPQSQHGDDSRGTLDRSRSSPRAHRHGAERRDWTLAEGGAAPDNPIDRYEKEEDQQHYHHHHHHHVTQPSVLSRAGDRNLGHKVIPQTHEHFDRPQTTLARHFDDDLATTLPTHRSQTPTLSRQQPTASTHNDPRNQTQQQRRSQQQLRPPPPPPPRDDWATPDVMEWEAVYSDEFQRTYFVGSNVYTGQQQTSWDLPKGARLSSSR
jgi:hypothetical protein